jgi:putative adhesin
MSDQEMQFADPDWKPSQQLGTKTGSQEGETFTPQPINADRLEQSQWRAAPPPPHQQAAYGGIPPYTGQVPQQMQGGAFRQRPYRRGGRGLWFWIILAFIIIGLMSGGFSSAFNRFGDSGRIYQQPGGQVAPQTQSFTVSGPPTLVINDDSGAITVLTSSDSTNVTVQATNNDGFFRNPNDAKLNASQNGNTINASVPDNGPGSADITVTVPQDSNLRLTTANGDIQVNGISGQMTLTTTDGSVQMTNDALTGSSNITTSGGDINFDGTIDKSGTYQFQSGSGSITVTLPGAPAFHLDASTNSGSINASDFPGVHVQSSNSGSAKANGNIGGNSPGASVALNSDTGDINLHQASKVNSSFP